MGLDDEVVEEEWHCVDNLVMKSLLYVMPIILQVVETLNTYHPTLVFKTFLHHVLHNLPFVQFYLMNSQSQD